MLNISEFLQEDISFVFLKVHRPEHYKEITHYVIIPLQQHHQTRRKLFEISHSLRSMMYGQDRYRRRYWVLPHCGGVFVEAMESGEGSFSMTYTHLQTVLYIILY